MISPSPRRAPGDPAPRAPRMFWTDARFFVGLALIAVSVAGVWWVVAAARQTIPVLAASSTIVPGQAVTAADLAVVDVALGSAADGYLAPHELEEGVVANRTIAEGELVPSAAVSSAERSAVTTVVVRSAVEVPGAVEPGTPVELWSAPLREGGVYDDPRVLVADAVVSAVAREDTVMGASGASIELVVGRDDVAAVLAAVASGAALSAVPQAAP
ncbi:SAF domain-containing protein [Microbacterium sp. NPDC055683]